MLEDLLVLLHEVGHCLHYFLSKDIAPYALQEVSPEVAEASSMSMEYIGLEHIGEYLNPSLYDRLIEDKVKNCIGMLSQCAMGDEFQHWIYANPNHSRQQRRNKWMELTNIYSPGIDYSGYELEHSMYYWQFSHILNMPFYLIDYAISEILAFTIWSNYKVDPNQTIKKYKAGCRLGATASVKRIYSTFGANFSFGDESIFLMSKHLQAVLDSR